MSGLASRLVDHALASTWSALPDDARAAAKTFLHDTIAVGVAGRNAFGADAVFETAATWTARAGCAVLGRAERLAAPYAAFVNAYQIHAQEFDCVHEPAVAHPLATVVAALLAEAGRRPLSGADFLVALSVGVDVVATLGVAVTSPLKFFRPATAGVFGCVAALTRARRLDRAVALDAMGYALAFASGTMQAHREGRPALAVQVAGAARSAIEAVDLAIAGMGAAHASIDGPFGYLSLFEDRFDPAAFDALGRVHRVTELSWKPFPTGRAAHGGIVAIQALKREHGFGAADVVSLVYRAPPLIARLVGRDAVPGMSTAHARLCFAWLGAVALANGSVGLDDFTPERLADPALHAIAASVRVEADDNPDPAAFVPAVAVATLKDGRVVEHEVAALFGSPAWPLSRDEHLAKARRCLAFGGVETAHRPLADAIDALETATDVASTLEAALRG